MEVVGNIIVCDTFTLLKKSINAISVTIDEVLFEKVVNSYSMDFSYYHGLRLFNSYGDRMPEIPEALKDEVVKFNIRFKLSFFIDGNPNGFGTTINVDYPALSNLTVNYIHTNGDIFRGLLKEHTHNFLLSMNNKIFASEDLSLN